MSNGEIFHYRSQTLLSDNYPTWRRKFILTLCLLCILAFPSAATGNAPILSASEIDYPPFCIVDDQGRAGGFSVELMRAALKAMGREVSFRTGPWAEVRGWLERGEVQALPLVGRTPEREFLFDFTFPYMSLHGAIVVRQDAKNIRSLNDLRGRTIAVMKGDNAEEFLRRKERDIEIHTTATFEDAFKELSEGRYDAVVIQRLLALRLIQETGLKNLKVIDHPIEDFRQDFCFAVKEGDRETLALLNEGLALVMADGTYRHLHAKWFAALELPSHRRIVIGGDHNYPPYEFLDENGRPAGYNVDLTRAIALKLGLDIEIRLGPWVNIREALAKGEIDALQGMFYSPERDLTFDFTPPHTVNHCVSVSRTGDGFPPVTIEELTDKRIVVQKSDIMHDFVVQKGLGAQVAAVDSQEIALRELADGKHDCALVARLTALYWIDKHGWDNLIVGKRPFISPEYCYAVPNNHKALLAQFSEGLKVLEETGEYRRIQEKWLGVYKEEPLSLIKALRYSAMVLIPLALLFLGFSLWSWSLRKQVVRRTAELSAVSERYQAILAAVPDIIMEVDDQKTYTLGNPAGIDFFGEDVIGREAAEFFVGEQYTYDTVKPLFNGNENVIYVESWQRRKDGEKRLLSWWCRVLKDKKGKVTGSLSTARDITEQKQMEDALRKSEVRYRALFEHSLDAFLLTSPDGSILDVNPAACRMFGRTAEEIKELGRNGLVDITDSRLQKALEERARTGRVHAEITMIRVDGTKFPAEITSTVYTDENNRQRTSMIIRDITVRKQAEKDLLEKMDALQQFQDSTVDRELMMIQLKREINELLKQAGRKEKYKIIE